MHTILFNVNEGWSSGEVDDKISLFSDGAGPFVEELFIDWGVFLVQIHLEVEWVVKSDVVFEFVSESGYVGDVVDQFHKVGLLIGCQGWVDSHELHWVVECNVHVIQKVVSEEISVDDDVLSENDLITDTQHCGSTWFGSHTDFLPCEIDADFGKTSLNDNGVVANNFGLLFGVSVIKSRVGIGDDVGDRVVDSPWYVVEWVDFFS